MQARQESFSLAVPRKSREIFPPSLPPSLPLDISLLLDGGCALTYAGLISNNLGLPAFCA